MRWSGCDPQPVYVTALAGHVAGRSSVLETHVEGWCSIDELSPAPAHRQQLTSAPQPPTLVPQPAPHAKTNPNPQAKTNPSPKNKIKPNLKPQAPFETPPPKGSRRLMGESSSEPSSESSTDSSSSLTSNSSAWFANSPLRYKKTPSPPRKTRPREPPKKPPSPSQRHHAPPHPRIPKGGHAKGYSPPSSPCRSPRQGGRGRVSTRRGKMFMLFFATRGCGGSSTARRPLARVDPPPPKGKRG